MLDSHPICAQNLLEAGAKKDHIEYIYIYNIHIQMLSDNDLV